MPIGFPYVKASATLTRDAGLLVAAVFFIATFPHADNIVCGEVFLVNTSPRGTADIPFPVLVDYQNHEESLSLLFIRRSAPNSKVILPSNLTVSMD